MFFQQGDESLRKYQQRFKTIENKETLRDLGKYDTGNWEGGGRPHPQMKISFL